MSCLLNRQHISKNVSRNKLIYNMNTVNAPQVVYQQFKLLPACSNCYGKNSGIYDEQEARYYYNYYYDVYCI